MTIFLVRDEYLQTGKAFLIYPLSRTLFLAPVYEELLFRGVLLPFFHKKHSAWVSIIISSILFGLRHMKNIFYQPMLSALCYQIGLTTLIGIVLGFVYNKTKNVWICVILHYLYNIVAWFWMMNM